MLGVNEGLPTSKISLDELSYYTFTLKRVSADELCSIGNINMADCYYFVRTF